MKGDFSRDSFNRAAHYTRVLMQQGRVQLDSDWNEQTSILLHYLRTLAADLIGPHGGPAGAGQNFEIGIKMSSDRRELDDLTIAPGRYYVDGILCEHEPKIVDGKEVGATYTRQPFYTSDRADKGERPEWPDLPFLVYLDVWERLLTSVEDPHIREVALGGPDTAARAQVVWQVRVAQLGETPPADVTPDGIMKTTLWRNIVGDPEDPARGRLQAIAQKPGDAEDTGPCTISPEARYRGAENQLYRVEIHRGGEAAAMGTVVDAEAPGVATFKWSRENGSTVFPIREYEGGDTVTLEHLGRDKRDGLQIGDWVEIVDDSYVLGNEVVPLRQVEKLDPVEMVVTLKAGPPDTNFGRNPARHPLLRRWDQKAGDERTGGQKLIGGAARIVATTSTNESEGWLVLEDGIYIKFQPDKTYKTGDYWLIPARTATGDVEWPRLGNRPLALPPHGVEHHYAPLASVGVTVASHEFMTTDLRRFITTATSAIPRS